MGKGGQYRRKLLRDQADYAIQHGLLGDRRKLSIKEAFSLFWAIHNNKTSVFSISKLSGIDLDEPYLLPKQLRKSWIDKICFVAFAALAKRTGIVTQLIRAGCSVASLFENSFCCKIDRCQVPTSSTSAAPTSSSSSSSIKIDQREKQQANIQKHERSHILPVTQPTLQLCHMLQTYMRRLPVSTQAWVVYELVEMCKGFHWKNIVGGFETHVETCSGCGVLVAHPFQWNEGCRHFQSDQHSQRALDISRKAAATFKAKHSIGGAKWNYWQNNECKARFAAVKPVYTGNEAVTSIATELQPKRHSFCLKCILEHISAPENCESWCCPSCLNESHHSSPLIDPWAVTTPSISKKMSLARFLKLPVKTPSRCEQTKNNKAKNKSTASARKSVHASTVKKPKQKKLTRQQKQSIRRQLDKEYAQVAEHANHTDPKVMKKSVSRTELSTDYHNKSSLAVPPPELVAAIVEAGTTVRNLKAEKADFKDALQILLNLKTQYKDITGKIYTPPGYKPQRRNTKKRALHDKHLQVAAEEIRRIELMRRSRQEQNEHEVSKIQHKQPRLYDTRHTMHTVGTAKNLTTEQRRTLLQKILKQNEWADLENLALQGKISTVRDGTSMSRNNVLYLSYPECENRLFRRHLHALIKTFHPRLRTDTVKQEESNILKGKISDRIDNKNGSRLQLTEQTNKTKSNGIKYLLRVWHTNSDNKVPCSRIVPNMSIVDPPLIDIFVKNEQPLAQQQNKNFESQMSKRQQRGWRGNAVLALPAGNSLLCGTDRDRRMELFFEAVQCGNFSRVYHLVQAGVDVDARNEYGHTALLTCIWYGFGKIATFLQTIGADISILANDSTSLEDARRVVNRTSIVRECTVTENCSSDNPRGEICDLIPLMKLKGNETLATTEAVHIAAGLSFTIDGAFSPAFLRQLDTLRLTLPLAQEKKTKSHSRRRYYCDVRGDVSREIRCVLKSHGFNLTPLSKMRFLEYTAPEQALPPHVDLSRTTSLGVTSTHTFILYLTDCAHGGETSLLTHVLPESEPEHRICNVKPVLGRLLFFPHMCPHEGRLVKSLPKVLLRGELLDVKKNFVAETNIIPPSGELLPH